MAACFTSDTSEVERAALLGSTESRFRTARIAERQRAGKGFDVKMSGAFATMRPLLQT